MVGLASDSPDPFIVEKYGGDGELEAGESNSAFSPFYNHK